jgi:excisionase family DNA binding protein
MESIATEIMTIEETCLYLRIPRSSLYKLAQEGKIPCQKVGRHWRFRRGALDRWIEGTQASINITENQLDKSIASVKKD